jgi:glutamate---cysteine ligase / carboxylate-amine ligase
MANPPRAATYTFGIEEEYFLADRKTGRLATAVSPGVLDAARGVIGDAATAEFLQSQLEIATPVLQSPEKALGLLRGYRQRLDTTVAAQGLRLVSAGTYPLSSWRSQRVTVQPRYERLLADFRAVGERNLVCGLHVHVGIPGDVDRVRLMNRVLRWLPLFLALSTSSPFWGMRLTGLLSFRQVVFDAWPRSGIPDFFEDQADYDAFAARLAEVDAARDASFLWWAIRPSLRFPTLELRIADACTRVEDAVALSQLYRCLVAALVEDPAWCAEHSTHTRRLIDENRWRAKRDGVGARLIDEQRRIAEPVPVVLDALLERLAPQVDAFGCAAALVPLRHVVEGSGHSSAHEQLRHYNAGRAAGEDRNRALQRVAGWLAETTVA